MKVPKEAICRQIIALVPVYMNALMMGGAIGWLPNAIYFLLNGEEVHGTYSQCALIVCFSEFGKIVFAIPAGILIDKYGRKKITISIAVLHLFAWLGVSLNTSINMIYASRFLTGLAMAMVDGTSLIIIGEIASPEIRGRLTGLYQMFVIFGMISTSILSVIFFSYKLLSYGMTFLSLISLLPMCWMAETPSHLISISHLDNAKKNLQRIRKGYHENEINTEFEKLSSYIQEEKIRKNEMSLKKFLQLKPIRKPLMIGTSVIFYVLLTGGIISFGSYVTIIFPSNDHLPKIYYPLIAQIFTFFVSTCSSLFLDKFPRRVTLLCGAAIITTSNAMCMFAYYFYAENQNMTIFQTIYVLGNVLNGTCFYMILTPMTNAIKSELYPQAVKGFGGSLSVISNGLALIIVYELYTFFNYHYYLYVLYGIFSMNSFILYIVVYFFLPESCKVDLVDLQMKFKEESKCEDDKVEKCYLK